MRHGIPVSPGVAVGTAYCIHEIYFDRQAQPLEDDQVLQELDRFERSLERTEDDLRDLYTKVASQVGQNEAEIFHAHETILRDPAFLAKMNDWIVNHRLRAEAALHHVMNDYTSLFARTKDEYIKERLADVRDVIVRLSGHLSPVLQEGSTSLAGPLIVVADELLPSHVVALGDREVTGIVTQAGGRTSHAAILARSRGIPAVSGVGGIVRQVNNGDLIVVDGRAGHVIIKPDAETEAAFRKLQREFVDLKDQLAENRDQPAVTADGHQVELLANINGIEDAQAAAAMGACGVGLFRTEYLFLTHRDVPSEEEQFNTYRQIIDASPNHSVTIRTLDLGGDKTIPYLGHSGEANPFLGWRSIRLSFEHPEFFMTQVRAVLRAAAVEDGKQKQVRLMFPMITTLEEMRKVRRLVSKAKDDLSQSSKEFGRVSIGLMVEVPAAAVTIDDLLEVVDFISIGSNDLVQYLMAADRDNPKVNHLCQPLSPPVLRVLRDVIAACARARKHVTLCGEMAGLPRAFVLLFAMGLRSFSMSPAFIPSIKELVSHLNQRDAEKLLERVLRFKTSRQIRDYMGKQVHELCPSLDLLDSA